MNTYIGVQGQARKASNLYVGVNGQARKVIKGYIGVNGQARLFYDGNSGGKFWGNLFPVPYALNADSHTVNDCFVYPTGSAIAPMQFNHLGIYFDTSYLYGDNYFGIWGQYNPYIDLLNLIGPFFAPISSGYGDGFIDVHDLPLLRDIWIENGDGVYAYAVAYDAVLDMYRSYVLGDLVYLAFLDSFHAQNGRILTGAFVAPKDETARMEIQSNYVSIQSVLADYTPIIKLI